MAVLGSDGNIEIRIWGEVTVCADPGRDNHQGPMLAILEVCLKGKRNGTLFVLTLVPSR